MTGERSWSAAWQEATDALTLYGQKRDPADFSRFRQALAIPLSDREARIEINKPDYDYMKASDWLRRGGNHPDDIPGMILLYRCCAEYPYFDSAAALWQDSDTYLVRLESLGDELRAEISSAAPSRKRIDALLGQVRAVEAGVRPLEQDFDTTINEAARSLKSTLAWFIYAIISILIVFGGRSFTAD